MRRKTGRRQTNERADYEERHPLCKDRTCGLCRSVFWSWSLDRNRDRRVHMSLLLPILVVLIGLVTLFFADKRGNCVSEQTVISVAVVTWLFGYVTGIVIGG